MMAADFANVDFDADTGTDEIIQKLFQLKSAKKKKKVRATSVKSCGDVVTKNDITDCSTSDKEQKHIKRKKKKTDIGISKKMLAGKMKSVDTDLTGTSAENDKLLQDPENNEHTPRRIRKNKYYSLSQSQQKSKCQTAVKKKSTDTYCNGEESVESEESTKTKIKLNKPNRKRKITPESVCLSQDSSKGKALYGSCPTRFKTNQQHLCTKEDEVLPVLQAMEVHPDVRDDFNFSKSSTNEKVKRKLNVTKVTDYCADISIKKEKHKDSMENRSLLETKKPKLKHEKATKNSPFSVPKLREVLSVKKNSDKTTKSVPSLENTALKKKANKACNKELKSLKDRMQEQLRAARFRYLNEQLYSGSGAAAYELFKNDQDSFRIYHEGFQSQVLKWPNNPLDRIIDYVKKSRSSHVIADFGCGDGRLAERVPQKVHSFDLVALKPHVTACDMAHVPLKTATVDICIFCLSLMGTNLLDYLLEAHRVLKMDGILLIAEVISRFENVASFVRKLEKLGFILLNEDITSKMFIFFEFKKKAGYSNTLLPQITLEPCVYKKR